MKLTLEIDLDNSAFFYEDSDTDRDGGQIESARNSEEIARILNGLARLTGGFGFLCEKDGGKLRDINGNTCGHWQITEEN